MTLTAPTLPFVRLTVTVTVAWALWPASKVTVVGAIDTVHDHGAAVGTLQPGDEVQQAVAGEDLVSRCL